LATSSSTSTDGGAASATIGGMSEDQIVEVVKGLRAAFDSERTLPYDWRMYDLIHKFNDHSLRYFSLAIC
jgi:hypothetical protein